LAFLLETFTRERKGVCVEEEEVLPRRRICPEEEVNQDLHDT
jgi:hypothetical protein